MARLNQYLLFLAICICLSGCAVVKLPGQVLEVVGKVVETTGKAVETAGKAVESAGGVAKSAIESPAAEKALELQ